MLLLPPDLKYLFLLFSRRRSSGVDLGHPADAAPDRGPHPGVHRGRGRDQPDPVGRHPARLDRHLLQQMPRNPKGLKGQMHALREKRSVFGFGDLESSQLHLCSPWNYSSFDKWYRVSCVLI